MTELKKDEFEVAKLFIIPALIGGVIAWIVSGDIRLGLIISLSVFIGNWIGYVIMKKR